MVVDFFLEVVYTLGEWAIGLLPDYNPWSQPGMEWFKGGDYESGFIQVWVTANYFLPLSEMVGVVVVYSAVLLLVMGIKFAIKLIPGVG